MSRQINDALHALREMWLNFPGLDFGSLSRSCIQEMSPEQADFYEQACKVASAPPLADPDVEADKPAGVPVSEIEKLWASIEHLPSMQCAGQFMSGMASLIKRFKDPHHG